MIIIGPKLERNEGILFLFGYPEVKSIQFTSPDRRISLVTFCCCYQSFSYMEHQNLPTMLS